MVANRVNLYLTLNTSSRQRKPKKLRSKLNVFDVITQLSKPAVAEAFARIEVTLYCFRLLQGLCFFPNTNLLVVAARSDYLSEFRVSPRHPPNRSFVLSAKLLRADPFVYLLISLLVLLLA